jgi:outer membrane protein assembly factor BamB
MRRVRETCGPTFRISQKRRIGTAWLTAVWLGAAFVGSPTVAFAQTPRDWPQFLGPNRNGVTSEGCRTSWDDKGPREVWRVPGGVGMSGIVVTGKRVFTMVQKEGQQFAICLDDFTGETKWEVGLAPAYKNAMGDGPRATPAVGGDVAYFFTGEGILAALKTADGAVLWNKDVVSELGGKPAEYGMACSPLVLGDRVIVTVGAPDATVAAFDTKAGQTVWTAGKDAPAGYSSPALLKAGGREQLVVFHGSGALGLDPKAGSELWSYPYETDFNCNIATPVAVLGNVFLSSGENHGSVLLSLKPRGEKFDLVTAWESHGPKSVMRNEWQTSVLIDGYLYGFDNVGSAGPVTHLVCVEAVTGKQKWLQPRFGKGNLIAANGHLIISTMQGELVIVKARPDRYDELGRKTVIGKTRQAPTVANGHIYLRDDREIVCVY